MRASARAPIESTASSTCSQLHARPHEVLQRPAKRARKSSWKAAEGRRSEPKGQGGVSRNGPAWTEQEDAQLMQLVSVHGRKWKIIAESIPNRTHDALRNRYERLLKLTENGGSRANGHAASESTDGKQHIPGAANFVPASADDMNL